MSRQLAAARKLLSDAQLIAFLREAAKEDHPRAPGVMCRDLDRGMSLDEIFQPPQRPEGRAVLMQAILEVKPAGTLTYMIRVGFRGEVGDGGEWRVRYNAHDAVVELEGGLMGIH